MGKRLTDDNVMRVSVEPPEGTRKTFITPNWCNKTTWFQNSTKVTGQELTPVVAGSIYSASSAWVDNFHGQFSGEDFAKTAAGDVPRLKVYVDGNEKTEVDPHTGSGDYTVNYLTGTVTFVPTINPLATVTVDAWEIDSSEWIVAPLPGKKLKVVYVEAQFSDDVILKDSVHFSVYGLVDVFAPELVPGTYESGTKIPLGDPVIYKTMMDYINEANGALPRVEKHPVQGLGWRDLQANIQTFPWNYQAVTELSDAAGMEIRIKLEHDEPFDGSVATATLYCLSYPEVL